MVAKSQLKKITKLYVREQHKDQAAAVKEKEDAESREKNMEEAKKARHCFHRCFMFGFIVFMTNITKLYMK